MMTPLNADILLVTATIGGILAVSSIVAGWAVRQWPLAAMLWLLIMAEIALYVHVTSHDGLQITDFPDAFIDVAARVLN